MCKKTRSGRLACKDTDGGVEACHYKRGRMTCSDNNEELIETMHKPKAHPAAWWGPKKVHCKKNRLGHVSCTDGDDNDDFHV